MTIKNDVVGGLLAAIMSLPAGIGYGVLVFGSLGPEAAVRGVTTSLITLALLNLGSAAMGACRPLVASPTSLPTVVLAAAVLSLGAAGEYSIDQIFLIVHIAVFAGALVQMAIAGFRLGDLVKYIPYPVRSGLLTGTGILMLASQAHHLLGIEAGESWRQAQMMTIALAAVTVIATLWAPRLGKVIPAGIVGLVVGSLVYLLLSQWLDSDSLGGQMGAITGGLPAPHGLTGWFALMQTEWRSLLLVILPLSVALGLVASLETLIAVMAADQKSGERTAANAELLAQGIGNLLCAVFGGIAGAGSPSRTMLAQQYGAGTTRCRLVAGLAALALLGWLSPLVAFIPVAVMAAALAVLAVNLMDPWIPKALMSVLRERKVRGNFVAHNAVIATTVVVLMLVVGVIEAVAGGVILALIYFVMRMGKHIVRREFHAGEFHSGTQRDAEEFQLLEQHGHSLRVIEAEGSLFFGTADALSQRIDARIQQGASCVILNLQGVAEIELTGAEELKAAIRRWQKAGVRILLCFAAQSAHGRRIQALEIAAAAGEENCMDTLGDALSEAEDRLLDQFLAPDRYEREHPLTGFLSLSGFGPEELARLAECLVPKPLRNQEVLFEQGAAAGSVYFISKGRVSAILSSHNGEKLRVATLSPGATVGELALIDGRPRSTTVIAEGEVLCLELSTEAFSRLAQTEPDMAIKLLQGLAREISMRLRSANRSVR